MEEEDDIDNEEWKSGKLRASNEITEIFNVVLTLAWNEISTEYDSMSAAEQANLMKSLSFNWADLLSSEYAFTLSLDLFRCDVFLSAET